jgi:NAD-dependent dihydropyrimidine dehydrogenase PreA subunit
MLLNILFLSEYFSIVFKFGYYGNMSEFFILCIQINSCHIKNQMVEKERSKVALLCPFGVLVRQGSLSMDFCPIIDQDQCKGCEECLEICTADVFEMRDGKSAPVNSDQCTGCESCVVVCKEQAIRLEESRAGLSEQCSFLLSEIL